MVAHGGDGLKSHVTVAFRFPSMLSMRSSKVIFTRSEGSANRRDRKISCSISLVGTVPCPISRIPHPSRSSEVIKPPMLTRLRRGKNHGWNVRRHASCGVTTADPMIRGLESS